MIYVYTGYIRLGEPPNVKPNIEFTYDSKEPQVQKVLSHLFSSSSSSNKEDQVEKPKLEFKRTLDNKDFFALSTGKNNEENALEEEEEIVKSPAVQRQRRNSTAVLVKELLRLTLEERDNPKPTATVNQKEQEDASSGEKEKKPEKHLKTLVIELEHDDEFFKMLLEELEQAASLQDVTSERFKEDISTLETRMTKVVRETFKNLSLCVCVCVFLIHSPLSP